MPELRLVKVIVQPVFILDHGTHVTELDHPAVAIPATDWPTYSGERFPREVAEWQARIDAEHPEAQDGSADSAAAAPARPPSQTSNRSKP